MCGVEKPYCNGQIRLSCEMMETEGRIYRMKYFNTEGLCNPNKHYMVDITERLHEIKKMIDAGKYFVAVRVC